MVWTPTFFANCYVQRKPGVCWNWPGSHSEGALLKQKKPLKQHHCSDTAKARFQQHCLTLEWLFPKPWAIVPIVKIELWYGESVSLVTLVYISNSLTPGSSWYHSLFNIISRLQQKSQFMYNPEWNIYSLLLNRSEDWLDSTSLFIWTIGILVNLFCWRLSHKNYPVSPHSVKNERGLNTSKSKIRNLNFDDLI